MRLLETMNASPFPGQTVVMTFAAQEEGRKASFGVMFVVRRTRNGMLEFWRGNDYGAKGAYVIALAGGPEDANWLQVFYGPLFPAWEEWTGAGEYTDDFILRILPSGHSYTWAEARQWFANRMRNDSIAAREQGLQERLLDVRGLLDWRVPTLEEVARIRPNPKSGWE